MTQTQTRQPLVARMTSNHRGASFRRRRRRRRTTRSTTLCVWTALLAILVWTIHAQPIFAGIYEDFMGKSSSSSSTSAIRIGLDRCLDCEHWETCWWGSSYIPIHRSVVYAERLWEGLLAFCTTLEVLVRGFTLGFGLRMLKYLFWEGAEESYRNKVMVSAVAGLSLAAFLFGSSLFVPAEFREEWFDYHQHYNSNSNNNNYYNFMDHRQSPNPKVDVPQALYRYIRRKLVQDYTNADGTLECPSDCEGEICKQVLTMIVIDFGSYLLERAGTGLSNLTTTLEVLLRGFSLGFGARMLKFFFWNTSTNVVQDHRQDSDRLLLESFRHQAFVSALAGVSSSAFVHGSSLFVPVQLRDRWFVHGIDTDDVVSVLAQISFWGCMLLLIWFVFGCCCGGRCKRKNS